MRTLPQAFGVAVRHRRDQLGHSQAGFAHASWTSRTYMSGIERGVMNVSLETIARLADALGISASRLLADAEAERR